jgi:hypothetical protein
MSNATVTKGNKSGNKNANKPTVNMPTTSDVADKLVASLSIDTPKSEPVVIETPKPEMVVEHPKPELIPEPEVVVKPVVTNVLVSELIPDEPPVVERGRKTGSRIIDKVLEKIMSLPADGQMYRIHDWERNEQGAYICKASLLKEFESMLSGYTIAHAKNVMNKQTGQIEAASRLYAKLG